MFAERLADIPDFHQTRGALRLVARTIRAAWEGRKHLAKPLLLHAHHVDLARSEIRSSWPLKTSRPLPAVEALPALMPRLARGMWVPYEP